MPLVTPAPPQVTSTVKSRGSDKRNIAVLLLCCAALFIWRLWSPPLLDPGDGYFTEAAREMVESGDYIVPHLNYQIYFSKPILIYWLISSAYHVLGVNEFAGRIWSAIMATALVLCTYWTLRCIHNKRSALLAGAILASSPLVVTFARMSLVDMTFSSLLGIAWCGLLMTVATDSRKWWPVIYAALGLSVLTKGPAGLVLFALACVTYLIAVRPGWSWIGEQFKKVHFIWGLTIMSAIVFPWNLAVGLATDWLYPKVFYLYENVGRYAGQTNHNHPEPWFYLLVLAYGFFPWVMFLPFALRNPRQLHDDQPRLRTAVVLSLAWTAAVFGFFTLATTKLQTYVLPAFMGMSVVLGLWFDYWMRRSEAGQALPRSWMWTSLTLAIVGALSPVGAIVAAIFLKHAYLSTKIALVTAGLVLALGLVQQYRLLRKGYAQKSAAWMIAAVTGASTVAAPALFDLGYAYKEEDLNKIVRHIRGHNADVAIYQEFKPALMFYLKAPIDSFFNPDQLELCAGNQAPTQYVIASKKRIAELIAAHGDKFKPVHEERKWAVYRAEGLKLRRLPTLEETFRNNLNLNCGKYHWGTLPFAAGKRWQEIQN